MTASHGATSCRDVTASLPRKFIAFVPIPERLPSAAGSPGRTLFQGLRPEREASYDSLPLIRMLRDWHSSAKLSRQDAETSGDRTSHSTLGHLWTRNEVRPLSRATLALEMRATTRVNPASYFDASADKSSTRMRTAGSPRMT